jgi:phosphatidylglycerophosphate synthase
MDIPKPSRKLPEKYESQVDNLLYKIIDPVATFLHDLNLTPNNITCLSFITGLLSAYFLHKGRILLFISFYIISYFLDCVDGYVARKYDMTSKFGDALDHNFDTIKNIIIFYIIIKKSIQTKSYLELITLGLLLLLTLQHLGCQECYYNSDESPTLSFLKKSCPTCKTCPGKSLPRTRNFGNGNFTVALCIITWIIFSKK